MNGRIFVRLSDGIEYLRIIRDPTPNQYMCLIKFKSQVRNQRLVLIISQFDNPL